MYAPVLCLLTAVTLAGQTAESVLARMDQAAPGFRAVIADVQMKTHTAILNDTIDESGTFTLQRHDGEVRAILDFSRQSDSRVIGVMGKLVRIYYPKLKTYQDYDLGKSSDVLNQFLLLGFGSSGRDLAQSYSISAEGQETVGAKQATKLLLIPKDEEVKKRLAKIEIWVADDAAYPVQQQFYEPSGNYRVVTYLNTRLNPPIKGKLELKLPSGVKKQSS